MITILLLLCLMFHPPPAKTKTMIISYYGKQHHGKMMASGKKFDMNKMTAAHRRLPFGTKLLIFFNKKHVLVTVMDRGPFKGKRQLDISYAAAKELGTLDKGVFKGKVLIL